MAGQSGTRRGAVSDDGDCHARERGQSPCARTIVVGAALLADVVRVAAAVVDRRLGTARAAVQNYLRWTSRELRRTSVSHIPNTSFFEGRFWKFRKTLIYQDQVGIWAHNLALIVTDPDQK